MVTLQPKFTQDDKRVRGRQLSEVNGPERRTFIYALFHLARISTVAVDTLDYGPEATVCTAYQ